jgi:hypothetical protein
MYPRRGLISSYTTGEVLPAIGTPVVSGCCVRFPCTLYTPPPAPAAGTAATGYKLQATIGTTVTDISDVLVPNGANQLVTFTVCSQDLTKLSTTKNVSLSAFAIGPNKSSAALSYSFPSLCITDCDDALKQCDSSVFGENQSVQAYVCSLDDLDEICGIVPDVCPPCSICPEAKECDECEEGSPWWILWMLIIMSLLVYIAMSRRRR